MSIAGLFRNAVYTGKKRHALHQPLEYKCSTDVCSFTSALWYILVFLFCWHVVQLLRCVSHTTFDWHNTVYDDPIDLYNTNWGEGEKGIWSRKFTQLCVCKNIHI